MIGRGLGEMRLSPDQLWDLSWLEYEYALEAYRRSKADLHEPIRLLFTLIHNGLFVDKTGKAKTPQELIPLFTDVPESAKPQVQQVRQETTEEFFARMEANNFFRPLTPKA